MAVLPEVGSLPTIGIWLQLIRVKANGTFYSFECGRLLDTIESIKGFSGCLFGTDFLTSASLPSWEIHELNFCTSSCFIFMFRNSTLKKNKGGLSCAKLSQQSTSFLGSMELFFLLRLLMVVLLNCWIVGLLNCWFFKLLNG